jgi:CelD/BcsL family acetyltransferase involved in cellulose biosynthesis
MKVLRIRACELDSQLRDCWRKLQRENPNLGSPFFCVEFTDAIGHARTDVELAIIMEGGEVTAIFPFQRGGWSVAKPVGGRLSDYQGIICRPDFTCDPIELLRNCSLVAWDFDHLLVSQSFFAAFHRHQGESPIVDLSDGYEAYAAHTRAARTKVMKLQRHLEREAGPVRFVFHSNREADLAQVLDWKTSQYLASGKTDLFALPWVRSAVERIHSTETPQFCGTLSLLYAGDRVVAGHFGMRAGTVWHYWFPAYDRDYAKYSPGFLLLLKMAETAVDLGIATIDLGRGMSPYKERVKNGCIMVADGSIESSWLKISRELLRTPLGKSVRRFVTQIRKP